MQNDTKIAAVDNDFVSKIVECDMEDTELFPLIESILSELNLSAVMHPLVFEKELVLQKDRTRLFFEKQIIHKTEFTEMFQSDIGKKQYYFYLVQFLYPKLMGKSLPVYGEGILTYWKCGENLGEVHSVSMCMTCGYGIFLSDDGHSKVLQRILTNNSIGEIEVYNRKELVDKHIQEGKTRIPRDKRRQIAHL